MADSRRGGCCGSCFSLISLAISITLSYWLFKTPSKPSCSIHAFYVPALNHTSNSATATNTTIYFDLKLENRNQLKGVYYDPITLTIYYVPNVTSVPIASYTVPEFYQGLRKTTHRRELADTRGADFRTVSNGSVVAFRVDLATKLRFKTWWWKTGRKNLAVRALVEVNDRGEKAEKKGIKLKSGAPELERHHFRVRLLVALGVFFFVFI
ncbi:hypothetical protein RJ639_047271 [Escallonia herrerae]|uniref:Late embryogenesis abundant protein LEA-2 subgroup domain-containing protein n=1 Tax=Escallonia herrerae TaxID=1293975 RepID=A0AA88W813_9ASTE|nr:hypothetical protein RJ639_047271 [Escallonia herrerae]